METEQPVQNKRARGRPSLGKSPEEIRTAERERLRRYYQENRLQVCERRRARYGMQKNVFIAQVKATE
jgi:hypothetical protein